MTKRDRGLERDAIQHQPLQLRKVHLEVDRRLLVGLAVLQHVHELAELEVLQLAAVGDERRPRGVGDFVAVPQRQRDQLVLQQVLHAIVGDGAVAQRHELQRRPTRVPEYADDVVVDVERAVLIELQEPGTGRKLRVKLASDSVANYAEANVLSVGRIFTDW